MNKRLCLSALATVVATMLIGCGSANDTNPAAPTPGMTVTAVTLASAAMTTSSVQMTATARLSDGSTRDVTSSSMWTTSDPSLAVVSASGVLTVMASGEVEVRAAYQGVMGTLKLQVSSSPPQPSYSLTGLVHEVSPNVRALSNVRIEITGGAGGSTVTDAAGFFRVNALNGVVSMQAVRDGYLVWKIGDLMVDRDRELDVALYPIPPTNAAGASATARCSDGSWSWSTSRADACAANGGFAYGVCPGPLCNALSP